MRSLLFGVAMVIGVLLLLSSSQKNQEMLKAGELSPEYDMFVHLPIIVKPAGLPPPSQPWVITDTITISSYQYDHPDCLIATEPGDFVYPYPRINHDCVLQKPKVERIFTAVSLHNDYTTITLLPELGGRLYQWHDKITQRQVLYNNPVLKPTAWGWRGWWLATGGIEWAFPTDEHGLNEYRPWDYNIEQTAVSATISLSDSDDQTGMEVGVKLTLDDRHRSITINPWVENNTAVVHNYQYWLNAMIAMNNNHVSNNTEFIVPANEVVIHSTADNTLPGERGIISWPVSNNRDLSHYSTWTDYIGFFAPVLNDNYTGIYDHDLQQGILRVVDRTQIPGHKYFGPASLGSGLWTDDDSDYVEMWSSGVTTDFWTYRTISSTERIAWEETWLVYNQFPAITTANENGFLSVQQIGDEMIIDVMSTAVIAGKLIVYDDKQTHQQWVVYLEPGIPQQMAWKRPSTQTRPIQIQLRDTANNGILLHYEIED